MLAPGRPLGLLRWVFVTYGLAYSLTAAQLILAHMAKEPFQPPLFSTLLLTAGALSAWAGPASLRAPVTLALCLVQTVAYLHYVLSVIRQVCAHLGINCLTIKPKPRRA